MRLSVVIPSRTASNVAHCVASIIEHEPNIDLRQLIVVDDGIDWNDLAAQTLPATFRIGFTVIKGKQPFVFARNSNMGITQALNQKAEAIVLMNDDSALKTEQGFTRLAENVRADVSFGPVSAAITAHIGNPNQQPRGTNGIRVEPRVLAYVCVCFSPKTLNRIGLLDESFHEDYGWEDSAHCREAQLNGLKLGIFDGCVVEHGRLPSTFRDQNRSVSVYNRNAQVYYRKYGDLCGLPVPHEWTAVRA